MFNGGAGAIGGAEVRAYSFARGLQQLTDHEISFVVRSNDRTESIDCDGMTVHFYQPPPPNRWEQITLDVQQWVERKPGFPWIRITQCNPQLLWKGPIAATRHLCWILGKEQHIGPKMLPFFQSLDFDVVCCFGTMLPIPNVVATFVGTNTKTVIFLVIDSDLTGEHGITYLTRRGQRRMTRLNQYSLNNADLVVVQSQYQQTEYRKRFGRDCVLIRNPIDIDNTLKVPEAAVDTPGNGIQADYALWVGRTDHMNQKRPELCIELARRVPEARFVMILNPHVQAAYDQLAQSVPENVTLIPGVPYDRIEDYFRKASILVSTSRLEGFPNVFIQAAKFQVPILSLDVDPDGMLESHKCGVICGGDFEQMVKSFELLRNDTQQRETMGQAGKRYVHKHHQLQDRVRELNDALMELVGKA